jgi:hypothetical protein
MSQSRDPYEMLRAELVAAAARTEVTSPSRRWQWLRRWGRGRTRPLAIVLVALAVCGTAAGAVLSLSSKPSQPLTGRVPGRLTAGSGSQRFGSVAGDRYRIVVVPGLAAGNPGWQYSFALLDRRGRELSGGGNVGNYPARLNPIWAPGGFSSGGGGPVRGETVYFALTGPGVVAVRVGTRTIRTLTSPELPDGDRAAVFFWPVRGPVPTIEWQTGEPLRSLVPLPSLRGTRPRLRFKAAPAIQTIAIVPLDRSGRPVTVRPRYPATSFQYYWARPGAPISPLAPIPAEHAPAHPARGICELMATGLHGLVAQSGMTIRNLPQPRDAIGELTTPCVTTVFTYGRSVLTAAVIVDALRPGRVLDRLPGARAVPGAPGFLDLAAAQFTARRVGKAWLVVQDVGYGPSVGLAQRLLVLRALRVTRFDIRSAP